MPGCAHGAGRVGVLGARRVAGACVLLLASCTPFRESYPEHDAGTRAEGQPTLKAAACAAGHCWWSIAKNACAATGLPSSSFRPSSDPSPPLDDLYFGWTAIRLSDPQATAESDVASDGQTLGLDLDGVCTNSLSCPDVRDTVSCRASAQQIPFDGADCRDNRLASALAIIGKVPEVGRRFGLNEELLNCELWRGTYNMIARVSGYNGLRDDDHVRVDWYASAGLTPEPSWHCPTDDFRKSYPLWRKSSVWRVDETELVNPIGEPGQLPESHVADPDAFVRENYLVAHLPDGALVRLAGDAQPFRGLALPVHEALWIGHVFKAPDNVWRMTDGLLAGRVRTTDVLRSLHETGFCRGMGVDAFYDSFQLYIEENADVLASGQNDPDAMCDALSFGIGFDAAQLTPGSSTSLPARVECCAAGMSAADCEPTCGDGQRTGDELCDTAIPHGEPGSCPERCASLDACTPQVLVGSNCDAHCVPQPISARISGDGCCPGAANATEDADCAAVCGNGVLEPDETCDRAAGCPACKTDDPCLLVTSTGTADNCTSACSYASINTCRTGDRCCPKGCNPSTDGDCSSRCGDGNVDRGSGETCEQRGDSVCPAGCDDGDPCTTDFETGSPANCNVTCTHAPVTRARAGDGCCPAGANANVDPDCNRNCGNGTVEGGEECDDGGRQSGDGCSDTCEIETPKKRCLERVGVQNPGTAQVDGDECAECVCNQCGTETAACYERENPEEVRLCDDLAHCVRATWCNGIACYCGSDLFGCTLGNPTGPCRAQVQAAAGTNSPSAVLERASDMNSPFGRAIALGSCAYDKCANECGFK
jgi:cysteine-rich repeat protein